MVKNKEPSPDDPEPDDHPTGQREQIDPGYDASDLDEESLFRASYDLQSYFHSTGTGAIFLDDEMRIRGFSAAIEDIYDLRREDIDRPISDVPSLVSDMPPFPKLKQIVRGETEQESVVSEAGRSYLRQVLPFHDHELVRRGIVITFTDVSAIHASEARAKNSARRMRTVAELAPAQIAFIDPSQRYVFTNQGYSQQFSRTTESIIGLTVQELLEPEIYDNVSQRIEAALAGEQQQFELEMQLPGDRHVVFKEVNYLPEKNADDEVVGCYIYAIDVTQRKRRELTLAFLARLQLTMAGLTTAEEIIQIAGGQVAEFLDLDNCCFIDIDEHTSLAKVFHDHHQPDRKSLCGEYQISQVWSPSDLAQLAVGETLVEHDASGSDRDRNSATHFRDQDVGSIVCTPCTRSAKLCFVLAACRSKPWKWREDELLLMREVATTIHLRIERARAEDQLRASEQRLRLGVEVADFALAQIDYTTDEVHLSADASRLYGFGERATTVSRERLHQQFHPDDQELINTFVAEGLTPDGSGKICLEHRLLISPRDIRWVNIRKQILFDHTQTPPRPSRGIFAAQDITANKRSELATRLSEERLRNAAEAAHFGMVYVDVADRSVTYSAELMRLVDTNVKKVDLKTNAGLPDWIYADDRPDCESFFRKLATLSENETRQFDLRIIRSDAMIRRVRLHVKAMFTEQHGYRRMTQLIGTMIDITQQHEFEQSLRIARDQAQAANISKSEFLANMSHEIRTPMTAILGYSDILQQKLTDQADQNCLEIIRRNGQFLLGIINDILDISKIEAGKFEVVGSAFRVDRLVNDVRSLMEVRAAEKELDFDIEIDGPTPLQIVNDAKRLKQILVNLVGNAIKFTEIGSVRLIVRHVRDVDSKLQFEIVDSGIGISGDQLQRLFRPFSQADSSVDRKFGGSGLGLAISKRLAEMMGGRIDVVSEFGIGSTFTLTIGTGPLADRTLVDPAEWWQQPTAKEIEYAVVDRDGLSGKILVVDDRRDIRFIAQHFVTSSGGTVEVAGNGLEAIEKIQQAKDRGTPFDIMVIDMQMPVLNGYEATRQLRREGFELPIIALTAHAMEGDREKCVEAGCNDYLSKPLDGPQFVAMLQRYLDNPN